MNSLGHILISLAVAVASASGIEDENRGRKDVKLVLNEAEKNIVPFLLEPGPVILDPKLYHGIGPVFMNPKCDAASACVDPLILGPGPVDLAASDLSNGLRSLNSKLMKEFTPKVKLNGSETTFGFSSIGIYTSLAIAMLGAGGDTETDLANFLGLHHQNSYLFGNIHQKLGKLIKSLETDTKSNISICERIFVNQNQCPLKDSYEKDVENYYNCVSVEKLEFVKNPKLSVDSINQWVNKQTVGRISKLYEYNSFDNERTGVVIVDNVRFEAEWTKQLMFDPSKTQKGAFRLGNEMLEVDMMNHLALVPYTKNKDSRYQSIGLSYKGSQERLFILLPDEGHNVNDLIQNMDDATLISIVSNEAHYMVNYTLPKTKIRTTRELRPIFRDLGLTIPFAEEGADFRNMTACSKARLASLKQALDVEFTESGSARIQTKYSPSGIEYEESDQIKAIKFRVDRPFAFYIFSKKYDKFLYSGVVYKPNYVQ